METQQMPRVEELATELRPSLTQLYVTYFRLAVRSDLTAPQLTILTRLADRGPHRISEIARLEGIRMPTASNALHQLEQRGLIERVRDRDDRRGVLVELTREGHRELDRVSKERVKHLVDMFGPLDDYELDVVEDMIPIIQKMANHYSPERIYAAKREQERRR